MQCRLSEAASLSGSIDEKTHREAPAWTPFYKESLNWNLRRLHNRNLQKIWPREFIMVFSPLIEV